MTGRNGQPGETGIHTTCYSEPYPRTGGLAAVGVLNQLGRPDMEPAEVLVREALQNCWDAKEPGRESVEVRIGRTTLDGDRLEAARTFFTDPPPGLPLRAELVPGADLLYFADYGTSGLGGPTRADRAGEPRDYLDFVLNIGQPPDKDLGGGSFGYGKAAFYLASRASTIIIDTRCRTADGTERRVIGCGLGDNFSDPDGQTYTGRHWWGSKGGEHALPCTGDAADAVAWALGLPHRGPTDLGTTIAVLAPDLTPDLPDTGADSNDDDFGARRSVTDPGTTMDFIAQAVVWNFWPRMVSTPDGQPASLTVTVTDNGRQVPVPNPRKHPRLRTFVDALDQLRNEPAENGTALGGLVIDRPIDRMRPVTHLGRVVIAKGPLAPGPADGIPLTRGARETRDGLHHVALLRAPEIVVRYLRGTPPVNPATGYAGVFRCFLDNDQVFKAAEPPTHDNWVYETIPDRDQRSMVRVALDRIQRVCREAAGSRTPDPASQHGQLPLAELSDSIARLVPGLYGTGSRLEPLRPGQRPGSTAGPKPPDTGVRIDPAGDPHPDLTESGMPVLTYPFELTTHGQTITLTTDVEIMNRDGDRTENEPPAGQAAPEVHSWLDPAGNTHTGRQVQTDTDGRWEVRVHLDPEIMVRVNITQTDDRTEIGTGTAAPRRARTE